MCSWGKGEYGTDGDANIQTWKNPTDTSMHSDEIGDEKICVLDAGITLFGYL